MAHISFTGNTTGDATLKFTPAGKAVLNINVAENHSRLNKDTNTHEDTGVTFRRVALWGKKAEHLADQIGKGSMVHVSGREETRTYTTKNGVEGTSLEVTADDVGLIYAKGGTNWSQQQGNQQPQQRPQQGQANPWGRQGSGNYHWGEPQGDAMPF